MEKTIFYAVIIKKKLYINTRIYCVYYKKLKNNDRWYLKLEKVVFLNERKHKSAFEL